MTLNRLETIQKKYIPSNNSFYQKYYHYFIIVLMVFLFLLCIVSGVVFYQAQHRPLPVFVAKQPSGQLLTLEPTYEPNLLPETIIRFASKAAVTAYTFDFVNYNKQIALARPYFTEDGWAAYLASVQGLLNSIVSKQLFVYGVVAGTPVIANQGGLPGQSYAWRVQIPFLVTYATSTGSVNTNYFAVLTVVKTSTNMNPQGIGIDQFVVE
jgi:intracellular multiplication protein IcmL